MSDENLDETKEQVVRVLRDFGVSEDKLKEIRKDSRAIKLYEAHEEIISIFNKYGLNVMERIMILEQLRFKFMMDSFSIAKIIAKGGM